MTRLPEFAPGARRKVESTKKRHLASPVRSVLFLQGPAGPFFAELGGILAARGHAVHKVNFNLGDRLFWRGRAATAFRGRPSHWPAACERLIRQFGVTDLVVFGDCRPLHRAAIAVATRLGIRVTVAEEGYLRPGWVTFEPHGANGHSALPRVPEWFLRAAANLPASAAPAVEPEPFARRATEDVVYSIAAMAGWPLYPFYRTHRPWPAALEYAGWLWRMLGQSAARRRSNARLAWLARTRPPYFIYPLQLECDFQLRTHSPFANQTAAIDRVLASFARWAPPACLLVVKPHPLENGLRNWRARLADAADRHHIAGRVVFIDTADLAPLIAGAHGMVTVNSTAGLLALSHGVPVRVLGSAIYDVPGLTSSAPLEAFWRNPTPPDAALFNAVRAVLIDRCLVRGGFYSPTARRAAATAAADRLEQPIRARRSAARASAPAAASLALADA